MQDPALPGSSPGPGPNAATTTAGSRAGLSPEATPGLRPDPTPALPAALLFALVFVEGFVSLGAEIVALRRLVPHVGSAITVTAPTARRPARHVPAARPVSEGNSPESLKSQSRVTTSPPHLPNRAVRPFRSTTGPKGRTLLLLAF